MTNVQAQANTQMMHEAGIRQALDTWFDSFNTGQIESCVECYHDDAIILMDKTPAIRGREAIQVAHNQWREAEPGVSESYELLEWGGSGDSAFCINSIQKHRDGNDRENGTLVAIVLNVLKRQASGDYLFHWTSIHMAQEG